MALPESYRDPAYDQADAATEKKFELPVGLLASVRTRGERSNASQVSSANATTPYQFIPATRKAILDKFGIDVTLSPENASEGAGLLLRDSLKRNDGDQSAAVSEYIGGTNRDNWGPQTRAYTGRVMVGQQQAKLSAMGAGFAKFMAANPAAPIPEPQTKESAPAQDALSAGFGNWLQNQSLADQIPEAVPGANARMAQERAQAAMQTPKADPSLVDQLIGAGEAGLTLATGATGGALGMAGGAIKGLAGSVMNGTFGTKTGVQATENAAAEGASALTYEPRTEVGQQRAQQLGEGMAAILPALPLTAELGALGRGMAPAAQAAKDIAAPGIARARAAAPAIAAKAGSMLRRTPAAEGAGGLSSAGSAATESATMRDVQAASLPVPVTLTRGAASRNAAQLGFEKEQMKSAEFGVPLRNRAELNSHQIMQNFDAFVDQTGAAAPDIHAASKSVVGAIAGKAATDKAKIRVAYVNAEKAGEMASPVSLAKLVDYLNESAPDAATAPLLTTARAQAIKLGIAKEINGQLVMQRRPGTVGSTLMNDRPAAGVTLKTAETYRQAINRNTDFEPTNIRQATIIKKLIDEATEGQGGDLYREARKLRTDYARKYENRAVVADLITNRKGMDDPKVAIDKVFDRTVMQGSADELRFLRRVLQTSGEDGRQAWKELQGATINHIRESSTALVKDSLDRDMISTAKLNAVIKKLDKNGKLEIMFGKKGAETMRTLNEVVAYVNTVPPGTLINTSGTAATLMAAMAEMGLNGSLFGLPLPVVSGLRQISKGIKDVKLKNRINAALAAPNNQ